MSTLVKIPELVGFFSYSREDDEAFGGTLSALRGGVERELSALLGRTKKTFRLWQDQMAIAPGELWELKIKTAVNESLFFIPIVTPRSTNSKYCKFEFELFLAREEALGRKDLIFPILYISVPALEDEAKWRDDPVLATIGQRQYVDWRSLRHLDGETSEVKRQIARFSERIVDALNKPWTSPEERQREMDKEEARRQAEAKAKRAEEEEARRQAEAKAKRAEEEEARRRAEAEAKRQAEEEEARRAKAKRAEEEQARRRAEAGAKRRLKEEEARRQAEAKAKRAEEEEARRRVEAERWAESAMAVDDQAELKAFLRAYPNGALAEQVRDRLQKLDSKTKFGPGRKAILAVLILVAGVLLYQLYH
jgi:hypothetical protein